MKRWIKMGAAAVLSGLVLAVMLAACQASPAESASSADTASAQKGPGSGLASSLVTAPDSGLESGSDPSSAEPNSDNEAENQAEPLRIYPVDLAGFEKPVAEGVEIPLYNAHGRVEDDIANWTAAFSAISEAVVPAYKTEHLEYGSHYGYDIAYGGAVQITTLDGAFSDTIAHRYDAALLKDGQATGMTWRYYATLPDGRFYFLDEAGEVLRYIIVGNILRLEGDTTIRWQGMDADQVAAESADDALAAYETFFDVTADTDTHAVTNCLHIIPPSQSEEDWYHMYQIYVDQGGEAWDDGILVGLVYMNQTDPTKWQVYDDATHNYIPLTLNSDGRFVKGAEAG